MFRRTFFSITSRVTQCCRSDGFRKVICAARIPAAKKAFAVNIHNQLKNNSWSLAEYAESRTFCGVPVLRHDCDDVMGERHLDAGIVNRNIVAKVAAALKSARNSALPIIAGESGSGKTVAAILSGAKGNAIVIYIAPSQQPPDARFASRGVQGHAARTAAVVSAVANAVRGVLLNRSWPTKASNLTPVTVVCDELGDRPYFLRGLCRARGAVCARLQGKLLVPRVRIIAVGTGTEAVNGDPGSLPSQYRVYLTDNGDVWKKMADDVSAFSDALKNSTDASAGMLRDVLGNARCAAALKLLVEDPILVDLPHSVAKRVFTAMIPSLLLQVVLKFKSLNALEKLSEAEAVAAIAVVMRRTLGPIPQANWSMLVKHGIVTDLASYLDASKPTDGSLPAHSRRGPPSRRVYTYRLFAPKEGRYGMTAAQVAFVRLRYGMGPHPVTGDGFERLIKDYLIIATNVALAAPGPMKVGGVIQRHRSGWSDADAIVQALSVQKLAGVAQLDVGFRLQPALFARGTGRATRRAFAKWRAMANRELRARKCVVVDNAPMAESFDVAWMVHRHLNLIQIKKYDNSRLQSYEAANELHKMGSRHWTSQLGREVAVIEAEDVRRKFGACYAQKHVKGERVARQSLFNALLQAKHRVRVSRRCQVEGELSRLVRGKRGHTKYMLVVAGKQPADIPIEMQNVGCTFVHIPTGMSPTALFPIAVPRSANATPSLIDWAT